ncbi:MAG: quinolinate synthase NadA [Gammaproteobacteria bacterium]|nr:quinolinate synthase NadA [Gammaproteobacteria bacterium]
MMNLEYYQELNSAELKKLIQETRGKLGKKLFILAHYYQIDDIVDLSDAQGDSFALASQGAQNKEAQYIVFCGVRFMAEASATLAREGQRVFMPDTDAGCPLADLADIDQVEEAWQTLQEAGVAQDTIPITYMNSSSELKAFCGKNGGLVCTSSNAGKAFDWALKQKPKIFFFPDEHLGRNTANAKNIQESEIALWDPLKEHGANPNQDLQNAKVILWKGFCHVHTFFNLEQIKLMREKHPGCKIAVHPECPEHVVQAADGNGSTSYLKKFVEEDDSGKTLVIGTEINMVSRLAKHNPDKKVVPLARSLCPNMFKTSLADLAYVLENLPNVNEITVPDYIKNDAKLALERMLTLT